MKHQNRQRFTFLRLGLILGLILPAQLVAQTDEVEKDEEKDEEIAVLSPFEVTAEEDRGYASLYTLGGSRINTYLENAPTSVITVNQKFMQDIIPIDVNEVLEWVSGVYKASTPRVNQLIIRGQNVGSNSLHFRDGLKETAGGFGTGRSDPFVVQRMEVIKGPAGVLFGAHPIGGIVNKVSKKPLSEKRTKIGFSIRSYDTYETTFDMNRTFGENNKTRSRILFKYKDGHTRHGGPDDEITFVPMLDYIIDEESNTVASFRYEYNDAHYAEARGLWFTDHENNLPFGIIPNDSKQHNPADPEAGRQAETHSFELTFKHSFDMFGAPWNMRALARHMRNNYQFRIYISSNHIVMDGQGIPLTDADGNILNFNSNITFPEYLQLRDSGQSVDIAVQNSIVRNRQNNFQESLVALDLNTEFDVGATRHRLFTYLQFDSRTRETGNWRFDWDTELQSIFNYRPRDPREILSNYRIDRPNQPIVIDTEGFNWAIQDNVSLFEDRLFLVGGMRYDWGRGGTTRADGTASAPRVHTDWTSKVGFVGKPWDGVSIFYSRSETFVPQTGENELGVPHKNQIGLQDEVGVKLNLLDSRIVATASWFAIDFSGQFITVQTVIPGQPGFTQVGEQLGSVTTDGWEADINLQPFDGLDLIISVQDINTGRVDRATGEIKKPRGVPTGFNYSIFGKYTFQKGPLEGLYAGLGLKNVADGRPGDGADSYRIPGFDIWKLICGYQRDHWRISAAIDNLTDDEYVVTSVAFFLITPGERRRYTVALDYTF
jgi:iron complex outermembrane receptor protein